MIALWLFAGFFGAVMYRVMTMWDDTNIGHILMFFVLIALGPISPFLMVLVFLMILLFDIF